MHRHDALERNARMEKMLEGKLAELKAERPALESLYASLMPDKRRRSIARKPSVTITAAAGATRTANVSVKWRRAAARPWLIRFFRRSD